MLRKLLSILSPDHTKQNTLRYTYAKNMLVVILITVIAAACYLIINYLILYHQTIATIIFEGILIASLIILFKYMKLLASVDESEKKLKSMMEGEQDAMVITDKKKIDKLLEEKNAQLVNAHLAKDQFLAHMSHELRIPLNGIIAMTQLLMSSSLPDDYKEQIDILNESEEHLLSVVNHLLDFSRIESGNLSIENNKFNLLENIHKIQSTYALKAQTKKIIFNCTINDDVPEFLTGDSAKIRQVLSNILDNAVKFTNIGKINLSVSVLKSETPKKYILFDVTDTGIGITPEIISRVFTPFQHSDYSMTSIYGGTGLGLAISKNLVDMMGGSIHVESTNEGSRFYFTIPLIETETSSVTETKIPLTIDEHNTKKPINSDILLVEDNQLNQRALKLLLDKLGFTVTIAADGENALAALTRHAYNLILMDCQMPNMDGYTTSIEIRKRERGTSSHIPIIGVTAHAQESNRQKCLNAGMDDYIAKPFNIDEFHNLLLKYILP